jgi:hypothetical protein
MAEQIVKQKPELNAFFKACLDNVEVGVENLKGSRVTITIKPEVANAMVDKFKENPAFQKYSWEAIRLAIKPFLQAEVAKTIAGQLGVVETQ